MSLNAKKLPAAASNNAKRPDPLEEGTYPARLVQVILMGVQKERPYKGEERAPRLYLRLTYEMLDEFMKDDDGNDLEDKPRWLSEEIPFMSLKADLAKSTKRYYALDPEARADGDWAQLVGAPCMVTVVTETDKRPGVDRIYEKVASVSSMRPKEAAKAPELKNPGRIFDFYEPNIDIFKELPEWIQEKIKSAVDYDGSALQSALEGAPAKKVDKGEAEPKKASKAPVDDADEDEKEDW